VAEEKAHAVKNVGRSLSTWYTVYHECWQILEPFPSDNPEVTKPYLHWKAYLRIHLFTLEIHHEQRNKRIWSGQVPCSLDVPGSLIKDLLARGGARGGFQQREAGPPDTVLGKHIFRILTIY
jgi:hypothetical protein